MKTMAVVNILIVTTEIRNVQGKIRPHLESDSQRGDSSQKGRQETVKSIKLWIIERQEHQLHGVWTEGIPPPSGQPWGKGGRKGVNDTWSSPSSVMATVEVCQDRREGDRWRQLRGQRPAEKEGFDLEHLPTTYTNKRAIMGARWEEWEEERPHHGKYLMLWVKGQLAGHHSETNNNINLWWVGRGLSRQSAYDHKMCTVHSSHISSTHLSPSNRNFIFKVENSMNEIHWIQLKKLTTRFRWTKIPPNNLHQQGSLFKA